MSSEAPLRVLSIAHAAVNREAGRLRYYPLAARSDLDVHLVVPKRWRQFGRTIDADAPDDPGLNVHVMPIALAHAGPMTWYLHVYPRLRRLIRQVRPQVIHLWEEPWSFVALQASLLAGDAAFVMEVDQNILKRLPPPFEAIRRTVLRRTTHVLSRSPEATEVVRARGYTGPVTMIGYGVDQETFKPQAAAIVNTPLRVGYVGRIVAEKGLDDALDAMARAKTPVSLAIMGEGPHEASLRQRIATLGLQDRVTFRGWGPPPAVAQFLRGLDALVLLTRTTNAVREQFGRVILEAQSCGVPVIGSDCGAIPSVVGPGGWIVPENAPDDLAQVFDRLASAPDALAACGRAGLENVAARFTYDAVARTLADTWVEAAASRNRRSATGPQVFDVMETAKR